MKYSDKLKHPKWQKKRLEIMERDGFQCQCCFGRDNPLTVHHKIYINGKDPWDYKNKSLITLCNICHNNVHEFINSLDGFDKFIADKGINTTDLFLIHWYLFKSYIINGKSIEQIITFSKSFTFTNPEQL
jgi:hypothetical protein